MADGTELTPEERASLVIPERGQAARQIRPRVWRFLVTISLGITLGLSLGLVFRWLP